MEVVTMTSLPLCDLQYVGGEGMLGPLTVMSSSRIYETWCLVFGVNILLLNTYNKNYMRANA